MQQCSLVRSLYSSIRAERRIQGRGIDPPGCLCSLDVPPGGAWNGRQQRVSSASGIRQTKDHGQVPPTRSLRRSSSRQMRESRARERRHAGGLCTPWDGSRMGDQGRLVRMLANDGCWIMQGPERYQVRARREMFGSVSRVFFLPPDNRKHSADVRLVLAQRPWLCLFLAQSRFRDPLLPGISALERTRISSSSSSQIKRHGEKGRRGGRKDQTAVSELMK
ncbi:hypothetical protein HDV57DRAFT_239311 [Trichoderma longibrachiatum]|uniref:Uncharacterized protein n=1 Tax=Trichoderma longibrachiatum ATCC 18648 TaxID=983965 RepID=A0A2T4BZQ7_TRILO|nr:hypothetical protein M440DRAFT_104330 [Trichoderma longibrachiatum ATCC 18648]